MTAPTATVIAGVSLATSERPYNGDRFDLALSSDGIEVRRAGQATRRLSWDQVSEWEVQDTHDGVLLTLRGRGAVTPLVVPHWTVDELEAVLRDVTTAEAPPAPAESPTVSASPTAAPERAQPGATEATDEPEPEPAPAPQPEGRRRRRFSRWKVVVTVALLAVVATAVTLVLLQSAGVIHLSFLGPTA